MIIKFSDVNIATITCIASIFSTTSNDTYVDLLKLCSEIKLSKDVKFVKYFHRENNGKYIQILKCNPSERINHIIDSDYSFDDQTEKKIINKAGRPKRKGFSNSATFGILLSPNRLINTKVCRNGTMQITGIRNKSECDLLMKKIATIMSSFHDMSVFSHPIIPVFREIAMIVYNIKILDESININNYKLYEFIDQNPNDEYFCIYESMEGRALELIWRDISFYIFQSGKINVTAIKNFEDIDESYKFITSFINNNIEHFALMGKVDTTIQLLKKNLEGPKQKSNEWIEMRKRRINASEVAAIFGMAYGNKSIDTFIDDKVKSIQGIDTFNGNKYTKYGECYEPIACELYKKYINDNRKYNVVILETSSIVHPVHDYIAASSDGVVFTFTKDFDISNIKTLEDIENNKNHIIDTYLIEIKCPFNYKRYTAEKVGNIKCIKCVNGFVPSYYWCQMQQQMFVCGQKNCDFINNKFIEYKNEQEYLEDKTENKGILMRYNIKGEKFPICLYPNNILEKDLIKAKKDLLIKLFSVKEKVKSSEYVYWKLEDRTIVEVDYDQQKYESAIPLIKKTHDKIIEESELPYDQYYF